MLPVFPVLLQSDSRGLFVGVPRDAYAIFGVLTELTHEGTAHPRDRVCGAPSSRFGHVKRMPGATRVRRFGGAANAVTRAAGSGMSRSPMTGLEGSSHIARVGHGCLS